jgi:hypothetical protein
MIKRKLLLTWARLKRVFGCHEPPIQGLDSIDLIGELKTGGVDLFIVNSNPKDASDETRRLLKQRIAGYLGAINSDRFKEEFGFPAAEQIRIIVVCASRPNPRLVEWIEGWQPWVMENQARLVWVEGIKAIPPKSESK